MKKTGIGLVLFLTALFAGAQGAVILEITGNVEVKAPGSAVWVPAEPGQALERTAQISTGFKSGALIAIDNSTVTLRALTSLSLEEILAAEGDERVVLGLKAGRLRVEVEPPSGGGKVDFSIRSPVVTASVRGTAFEFDGLRIRVEEGRVHLAGERGPGVYVGRGHEAAVEPERGRITGALESLKEGLSPPSPAGLDTAPAALSALASTPVTTGALDVNAGWE